MELRTYIQTRPPLLEGIVKTRNITEYHGISRNITEYGGMSRNMAEYHDIFPQYTGTSRYFPMLATRLFINRHLTTYFIIGKLVMDLSHFDGK